MISAPHSRPGWLPSGFTPPPAREVPFGHRLRPVTRTDLTRLLVAVPSLTDDAGRHALAGRLEDMALRTAYSYALLDTDETALLGGVRIQPSLAAGWDAEVGWWLVPECRGTDLARALDRLVPEWLAEAWPFRRVRLLGAGLALDWAEC